jgi:hypothetical protein
MNPRAGIPYVDPDDLDAWGKCDKTGLPCMYRDLRPQYGYVGTQLQWTGKMVNEKDLDEPNPQLMTPPKRPDPVPVPNPRFFFRPEAPPVPTGLTAPADKITPTTITLYWNPVEEATNYAVSWEIPNSGIVQSTLPLTDPDEMTASTYTIPCLLSKTAYIVRVASINNVAVFDPDVPGSSHEEGTPLSYNMSAWGTGSTPLGINRGVSSPGSLYLITK